MTIEEEEKEIDLLFMLLPPKQPSLMNAFITNDCNDIVINVWPWLLWCVIAASYAPVSSSVSALQYTIE